MQPFDVALTALPPSLSGAQEGIQALDLNAPASDAGRTYLVLGSLSGTEPGRCSSRRKGGARGYLGRRLGDPAFVSADPELIRPGSTPRG